MSKFKTSIPVDVDSIKKLLPAGSFLHGVSWDAQRSAVDVLWEHDDLKTGRDFPADYSLEKLKAEIKIAPPVATGVAATAPDGAGSALTEPIPVTTSAPRKPRR